jgi:hypothetical protein
LPLAFFFMASRLWLDRQQPEPATGDHASGIRGRTNAAMRLLGWGAIPIGGVIGGLLGGAIGLRQTILLAALGSLLPSIPVWLSALPRLHGSRSRPRSASHLAVCEFPANW